MKTFGHLTREERIRQVMGQRRQDLALVLENLSEGLNISAILRTAEAFGVGRVCIVHLPGVEPKLSKNASSGATKWLDVKRYTSIIEPWAELKKAGFAVIAAVVDPTAQSLWETQFKGQVAIMVGNEARGLSAEAVKLADKKVYLPMLGLTESLNVSAAAALFLYEVVRQKELSSSKIRQP